MTDIEKMTANEWLAHRQNKLDVFYEAGNELKPNPDCRTCDAPNDYVCFDCECHQFDNYFKGENKWTSTET